MNGVTSPLKETDKGSKVANLQDALKLMLEREAIYPNNPRARAAILAKLPSERQTQTYGVTTLYVVKTFQEEQQLRPDGTVGRQTADALNMLLKEWGVFDEPTEPEAPKYQVQGQVQLVDATPLAGVRVHAVDRDLRREQFLGEASTDRHGCYAITYTQDQFRRAEKGQADLIVRVLGPDGDVLAASEILFNAPESATVDLVIPENVLRPASEFERIDSELAPLLDGVSLAELTAEDVAFLVGETGLDAQHLGFFTTSHRLATETAVPAAFFYGLARQGYPMDLRPLLVLPVSALRSAIDVAIEANQVPRSLQSELDVIFRRWQALAARGGPAVRGGPG